ncbi:hypothetical protein CS062_21765 [Roseateles chitinivorans]|uniref:Uncharacterized protein n=1 Tax=Roseateles chitinivorans TaxID=2917965 RepID=A0A2G9C6A7_9BURK|nr:hypothetical protein CS062_21765 [Roseateles chitinivorans]
MSVVSRAGCADALASEHEVATLGAASMLHKGRPTVVIVGAGAAPTGPVARAPARASGLGLGEYATISPSQDLEPHGPESLAQTPNV